MPEPTKKFLDEQFGLIISDKQLGTEDEESTLDLLDRICAEEDPEERSRLRSQLMARVEREKDQAEQLWDEISEILDKPIEDT